MTHLAAQLADFAVAVREGGLPQDVAADVVGRVMDVLGNCLAARAEAGTGPEADHAPDRAVLRVVSSWGGPQEATVIGTSERLPAPAAALANGTLAHLLDFDDTHLPSVLHPSAGVVPAALAVAEASGSAGRDLLAAVAVGIEVTNRLGMASYVPELRTSTFFERGLHATSICGTIGAAVAAGMLMGLDADQLSSAQGIAASMGAGVIEANRTGGSVKRIHCGWAAHAGVVAAQLAREGVTGPPTVLEGRFGFFEALLGPGRYDLTPVADGLGESWEVLRTVYKPYPSNHFTHPGIDCALALRAAGLDPARVASARLGVAEPVLRTIAEPRADKVRPSSGYHAKFSGPFTVARALLGGGGGLGLHLDDFSDAVVADPVALDLAGRIEVYADERATELFPRAFAAVLTVEDDAGKVWEHRVDASRGAESAPLSTDELAVKFHLNATRSLSAERARALAEAIRSLGSGDGSVTVVLGLTRHELAGNHADPAEVPR